jgi:hypothetical protein
MLARAKGVWFRSTLVINSPILTTAVYAYDAVHRTRRNKAEAYGSNLADLTKVTHKLLERKSFAVVKALIIYQISNTYVPKY